MSLGAEPVLPVPVLVLPVLLLPGLLLPGLLLPGLTSSVSVNAMSAMLALGAKASIQNV
jgi:hypothetical protein